jgi:trehalose/maltose hydrolase-like predicted phosphorylase
MKKLIYGCLAVLLCLSAKAQNYDESPWHIPAKNIDPNNYYGITVGNGMVGIVSSPQAMHVQDVVLNGVYDNYQRGRVSNILKTFNHINLDLDIDSRRVGGEMIRNYQQVLDMKQAILTTTFDIEDLASVEHQVMSLRHLPFSAMVIMKITAKKDIRATPMAIMEAPDHLRDVKQLYAQIDRPHVSFPLMTSHGKSPSGSSEVAASSTFIFSEEHGHEPKVIHEDWDFNRHWAKFNVDIKAGETYEFALVGSTVASEHFADPLNEAERLTIYARLEGVERLLARHTRAWDKLWEGDIVIEGDLQSQKDVRSALYHLYSFAREGTAYSLSPMGLSGLGYNGHVFWDTELWMYPPLLMLQPEIARSLLEYRFERLEAAKQNAFAHGYKGAQFPWESADDGSEDTPVWALTGPFEHHITGCVGWAFWKYYQVTGDKQWLRDRGWLVLKEVANFWASRVERNGPGQYDIKNVIGANEWEENIDNNAFTNAIAKMTLGYATEAAEALGEKADPDWALVAENIPILKYPDGTTKENATYEGVMIKQADVNLLSYPLQFYTDKGQIRKDLKYYQARMSPDGPAMGFCVLASIYARLGETSKAYEVWANSFRPNAVPPFGVLSETRGGTNPYFATGAGGMLQTVLGGFGGLDITNEGIVQGKINKPGKWKKLEVKGYYKKD